MYWAYTRHGILPSRYAQLNFNEQIVVETFNEIEAEDIKQALEGGRNG